jgi:hypothetical protein
MVQPINYGVEVQDPTQAFLTAFKTGSAITESRLAQEQAQRQAEQQQRIAAAFDRLRQPGATAKDYADLAMQLPETQAKAVRESFSMINAEQQQNVLRQSGQVFSAFKSGQPDIAINLMDRQIEAKRNAGDEEGAKFLETWRDVAKQDPKAVEDYFGYTISQMPGGDKVITSAIALGGEKREQELQPFKVQENQAKAKKAAVDAKFAESNAVLDIEKKGWDIQKLQNDIDISRQNVRIAALNADIARENNVLKRQELEMKLGQAERDRDEKVRTKVADLETANSNIDNMLNTADRILKTPKNVIGSAAGPISSRVLTVSQDTADFEELVNTLGSQAFLAQIPSIKGMGALSNAEGEKLTAALQNFSLRQSPERLVENVREAQRLLMKARKNIAERSGLPQTPQDRPASATSTSGAPAGGPRAQQPVPGTPLIDSLLQKYGAQ